MKVGKLSSQQLACLRAASIDLLICAYGNEFFIAGQKGVDYARANPNQYHKYQRNTCESLRRLGLLSYHPGKSLRGEYTITTAGKKVLNAKV